MQNSFGSSGAFPPVIKNLLIINGLLYLALVSFQEAFGTDLNDILGMHYIGAEKFQIYQIVTYMFMHGDMTHIFFNMFAIWMFGKTLESVWGSKKFLTYYMITGLGAGFIHMIVVHIEISPVLQAVDNFLLNPKTF